MQETRALSATHSRASGRYAHSIWVASAVSASIGVPLVAFALVLAVGSAVAEDLENPQTESTRRFVSPYGDWTAEVPVTWNETVKPPRGDFSDHVEFSAPDGATLSVRFSTHDKKTIESWMAIETHEKGIAIDKRSNKSVSGRPATRLTYRQPLGEGLTVVKVVIDWGLNSILVTWMGKGGFSKESGARLELFLSSLRGPALQDAANEELRLARERIASGALPHGARLLEEIIAREPNGLAAGLAKLELERIKEPLARARDAENIADEAIERGASARPCANYQRRLDAMERTDTSVSSSIDRALLWLARHQQADGSFHMSAKPPRCVDHECQQVMPPDYDVGLTGLAVLALLGAGHSPHSHQNVTDPTTNASVSLGECTYRALLWLLTNQRSNGAIASGRCEKMMYNQAIATAALAEAYGYSPTEGLKRAAESALGYLLAARNPGRVWRYTERCGENDGSVTAWATLALVSGRDAGIPVEASVFREIARYYADATDNQTGDCGYLSRADAGVKVVVLGKNDRFSNHPTMSAIAMWSAAACGDSGFDRRSAYSARICRDLPNSDVDRLGRDYYYWYFGSSALATLGPGERSTPARRWTAAARKEILGAQYRADRWSKCRDGSWPADDRWACEGGAVYATAINVLALEAEWRQPEAGKR